MHLSQLRIHDRLGNHRCCSELDFGEGLLQGFPSFYLVQGQAAYGASRPCWYVWWFRGLRQDPGMSGKVVLHGPSPSSSQQCFFHPVHAALTRKHLQVSGQSNISLA